MARFPTPHSRTLLPACIFISEALHILRRLSRVINRSCAKPLQRKCSMRPPYLFCTRILSARSRCVCVWPPNVAEPEKWLSLLFELHSIDLNNVVNYTAGTGTRSGACGKWQTCLEEITNRCRCSGPRPYPTQLSLSVFRTMRVSKWVNKWAVYGCVCVRKKVKGRSHERGLANYQDHW